MGDELQGADSDYAGKRKCDTKNLSGAAIYAMIQAIRPITEKLACTAMYLPLELLPFGCITATAELVGCRKIYQNPFDKVHYIMDDTDAAIEITGNELLFGDWTPGRYAWEFANMKMLQEPIPAKGRQRLWEWVDKEKAAPY